MKEGFIRKLLKSTNVKNQHLSTLRLLLMLSDLLFSSLVAQRLREPKKPLGSCLQFIELNFAVQTQCRGGLFSPKYNWKILPQGLSYKLMLFFFILQRCKMHHFKAFDIINLLWRLTLVLILQEYIQTIQVVEETLSYWIGTI